jgi:hypothetical protein
MHASQYVMPPALWILPVSHAAQCALDVCALVDLPYRPAVHSVQLALVSKLHEPAAHCPLHELLVEPPEPNRPAAQSAHAVWPVSLWYWPFAHATQCPALVFSNAGVPYLPASQTAQLACETSAAYVPFAQTVQLDWSASGWNCPTEHGTQLASDSLMHVVLPTSSGLMSPAHFQKNSSLLLNFPG